jgi:4-amino-4-deoxy-L-arabinose transferase-like glycosyltransferase
VNVGALAAAPHGRRALITDLLALAGVATALRLLFFTGFFGSDEVVYVLGGFRILHDDWPADHYIGGIRYGVNLPIAASMWLFGTNEAAAALWGFAASVAEVLLVYTAGRGLIGRGGAFLAALLLALLPLHAHLAGRIMADSPLAFFVTLTFVLFWKAERTRSARLYLLAGAAAGTVFWIKESVTIFVLAFVAYPFIARRFDARWLAMVLGMTVMVAANCALFWLLTGDALHVFRTAAASVTRVLATPMADAPFYYLRYLLLDIRHTWLLGWLATIGLAAALWRCWSRPPLPRGHVFVVFWALGLMAVFSFLLVSVSPPRLIMKQTNYMTIFLAPLCLLAGMWLADRAVRVRLGVMLLAAAGALPLMALELLAIQGFAANSKSTVRYALRNPDVQVYGLRNAEMAARYYEDVFARHDLGRPPLIAPLGFSPGIAAHAYDGRRPDRHAMAVVDLQTMGWATDALKDLGALPRCWRPAGRLEPYLPPVAEATAVGVRLLARAVTQITGADAPRAWRELAEIRPALVFSTAPCG